jgi:acyl-CoA thioester hydrolase
MSRAAVDVPLRWSDQDVYGHVNHARTVTLLEDARVAVFFDGAGRFVDGILVADLHVDFRRPIPYGPEPVRVELWVEAIRAASFEVHYVVRSGPSEGDPVAAHARTKLVPYDLAAARPRRITGAERSFLAGLTEQEGR